MNEVSENGEVVTNCDRFCRPPEADSLAWATKSAPTVILPGPSFIRGLLQP